MLQEEQRRGGSVLGNDDDEDEDEFLTPASSPEPELEPEEMKTRPESDQYTRNKVVKLISRNFFSHTKLNI